MKKSVSGFSVPGVFITILAITIFLFTACDKDDSTNGGTASTTIKITDAAIDDASVTGAFVTISDIKLDGQSVQGFTKTTIDVNAYQNGATKTLGTFNLADRTYSNITFILDYDMDASGGSPGSYITTTGGVKHKLQSSSNSITINKSLALSGTSSIVADFDLRKIITRQSGGGADQYDFATATELESSIRVVAESKSATIAGTLTNTAVGTGKIIAYAYKKGTYNRSTEMQASGASNIQFKNAVSSSVVNGSGNYQLHFLESGEYEIHFANYTDTNADGQLELSGTLVVAGAAGLDLLGLNLNAGVILTANATATAILP
jgi:Domain of unknown function (DUF4382)